MPITPLHFGVLAPINALAPKRVSNASFIIANVLLDAKSIVFVLTGYGEISHDNHTLLNALLVALVISLFKFWSLRWWLGAFIGGVIHIFLDALVHTAMAPLGPWIQGNPFYMGWMEPLSIALLPLCVWLTVQYVSGIRDWFRKTQGLLRELISKPSFSAFWRALRG